jgi:hypothetical protein
MRSACSSANCTTFPAREPRAALVRAARVQGYAVPVKVVVGWFGVERREHYQPSAFPVFMLRDDEHATVFYGFPEFGAQAGT